MTFFFFFLVGPSGNGESVEIQTQRRPLSRAWPMGALPLPLAFAESCLHHNKALKIDMLLAAFFLSFFFFF